MFIKILFEINDDNDIRDYRYASLKFPARALSSQQSSLINIITKKVHYDNYLSQNYLDSLGMTRQLLK